MKKHIPSFAAGMLTMALVGSLGIGALAASGSFTITVDPINVQVNGEVFQPKDATGADVPVFSYNGTTYAPLRALAEAYGLEVGYDAESNMATVVEAGEALPTEESATTTYTFDYSYEEFKELWSLDDSRVDASGGGVFVRAINDEQTTLWLSQADRETAKRYFMDFCNEIRSNYEPLVLCTFWASGENVASMGQGPDATLSIKY